MTPGILHGPLTAAIYLVATGRRIPDPERKRRRLNCRGRHLLMPAPLLRMIGSR
jgi:hypothetical protein